MLTEVKKDLLEEEMSKLDDNAVKPPRAKLVVRVGVTGHRPNGLQAANKNMLNKHIQEVLVAIKDIVQVIHRDTVTYYDNSAPVLRLISPLAEGADRMVANEAISQGYELQCPLPFERNQYQKDFVTPDSWVEYNSLLNQATAVLELDGQVIDKDSAYLAVGQMVLNQCDILIAIWDGNEARGSGGTAQIVNEARLNLIPIIWINALPPHEICVVQLPGEWRTGVAQHLQRILTPPRESSLMDSYFNEKQRKVNWGFPYKLFFSLVGDGKLKPPQIRLPDSKEATQKEWEMEIWNKSPEFPREMVGQIEGGFMKYYAWADKLADYYANLYRTSFLTTYIFSGLAVFFALLSYAIQSTHSSWPIITEVFIIFFIVLVTYLANKYKWHKRWIDYRMLAELLRPMRFLAPLGQVTASFRVPAHASVDDIRTSWVNWYFRAVVREAGLMAIKIDTQYLNSYRSIIKEAEIKGQAIFHENNCKRYQRICHRLHNTGTALFTITFVAALSHLFYHGEYSHWLTVISAVFPALGAAFVGILFQGEFKRLEQRSKAMFNKLEELYSTENDVLVSYSKSKELAIETADCMLTEALDWHHMFKPRHLNLPG